MKRRSFIKNTATASLMTWITPSNILTVFEKGEGVAAESSFAMPHRQYAPYTWWHWMNGNITKTGITLDLEAMSQVGLGGFQMFEAGTGIPKGEVAYLSEKWLSMVDHTIAECKRLGLEFAMHNCPGWSSSGGPWINPPLAMQQFTWSETTLSGGKRFKGFLLEPPKRLNYYRDEAVVAYPMLDEGKVGWTALLHGLKTNQNDIDVKSMSPDGQFNEPLVLGRPGAESFLDITFADPYQLGSLTMLSAGNSKLTLHFSENGIDFTPVKELHAESAGTTASGYPEYMSANFVETKARYYRLTFWDLLKISMLSFSGSPKLDNWLSKANFPGVKELPVVASPTFTATINRSSVIDLTTKVSPEGELDWDVPEGNWTVLRIGHTAIGRTNHSAPSNGTGLECDKFSKTAFDFHWEQVFKNILPLLKAWNSGKIGLLIDSYEMGLQNWSPGFPSEFEKKQKYSLISYLPALTGRIIGDSDMTERFLRDFRKTQADLMAENYYGRFAELCRINNIVSYTEPYEGGNFEEMQIGRAVDISMGEFWAGHTMLWRNGALERTIKLASSIAHSKGQSIVGAESFTAEPGSGKWQQYPFGMKSQGDLMFTRGLTRIIFHRYAHQPHPTASPGMTMGPWGIHFDRTNTWFLKAREWVSYLTRCQYMLRKGTFVADIAYFIGEEVPGRTKNPEKTDYRPPVGYDYDLINSDCLIRECGMKDGRLENSHGVRYKVLVLPNIKVVSLPVLRKLVQLVNDGLILIGDAPSQTFGINDRSLNGEFEDLLGKLWGRTGKVGRVYQGPDIKKLLTGIGLAPDFLLTAKSTDPAVNFIHRKNADQDIYFIANRRRRREDVVCSFRMTNKVPEMWDPLTGKTTSVIFMTKHEGRVDIPLALEPSGSIFIVFKPGKSELGYQELYRNGVPLLAITKPSGKTRGLFAKIGDGFTVSCWIKPEIDIALAQDELLDGKTDHFAVYPAAGERYYGKGHAGSGFTVGRNGITLFERTEEITGAVLFVPIAISGWSRLVIVYEKNVPSVYLNNKLIKTGKNSGHIVHPSVGEAYQDDGASYYNGEMQDLELVDHAVSEMEIARMSLILPGPEPVQTVSSVNGTHKLCIWKNGSYEIKTPTGQVKQFDIKHLPPGKYLDKNWIVRFPEGSGAPGQINMDHLLGLQKHQEAGVKYFSGTAEYTTQFDFGSPAFAHQVKLDLGRVEVLAEVCLNGNVFPVLWAQPFSLDITSAVRPGLNKLSVKVTNLWPNRLIGDENLPAENDYNNSSPAGKFSALMNGGIKKMPDWYARGQPKPPGGRTTFTTWKHYNKDSPLLESGLLGPVTISIGALK